MILITLSSFLNAFVVYMSFYGPRRPVPVCIKRVSYGYRKKRDHLVIQGVLPVVSPGHPGHPGLLYPLITVLDEFN
jgi:hypothetical protein